jgi:hypothetical protein
MNRISSRPRREVHDKHLVRFHIPREMQIQREQENLEAPADSNNCKPPVPFRVPEVHRAPGEFDELPDELSDPSVGWTENRAQPWLGNGRAFFSRSPRANRG